MTMKLKNWIAVLLAVVCMVSVCACKDEKNEGNDPPPYAFVIDGVTVTPGAKAKDVLSALSSRNPTVSAKGSCLGGVDGEDVRYVYSGFYIETFRLSEGHADEEIRWICFTDDSVTTQRGIKIGSTADEVKAEYGTNASATDTLLAYQSSGTELRFKLRDGSVIEISYTVSE